MVLREMLHATYRLWFPEKHLPNEGAVDVMTETRRGRENGQSRALAELWPCEKLVAL